MPSGDPLSGGEAATRWIAFALALVAGAAELSWIAVDRFGKSIKAWFNPVAGKTGPSSSAAESIQRREPREVELLKEGEAMMKPNDENSEVQLTAPEEDWPPELKMCPGCCQRSADLPHFRSLNFPAWARRVVIDVR
jgi:hypothetical protein